MQYQYDGYNYILRLSRDDKLIESLDAFARETRLGGAWLMGLGGALEVEVGFYNLKTKEYAWRRFEKILEITSLQGNLSWVDGQPRWHIHGTFSDEECNAFGGHVKELKVAATCELFIHTFFNKKLTRSLDEEIGLKLLDV